MTVVATIISRDGIVHASDSLITERLRDGTVRPLDWNATKFMRVAACRGMLAYYGFAGWSGGWTTLAWLRSIARLSPRQPEEFAKLLAVRLESELRRLKVHRKRECGVGIHFAAYERVRGYWVPELFHISNWLDPSYRALRPGGVGWSRDSFVTMFPGRKGRTPTADRLALRKALQRGRFLMFNNGDPLLFNPVAGAFQQMVDHVGTRRVRRRVDIESWRAFARRPIEAVSNVARDFVKPEHRIVGGRTRDLALTPDGQFTSRSGDAR